MLLLKCKIGVKDRRHALKYSVLECIKMADKLLITKRNRGDVWLLDCSYPLRQIRKSLKNLYSCTVVSELNHGIYVNCPSDLFVLLLKSSMF